MFCPDYVDLHQIDLPLNRPFEFSFRLGRFLRVFIAFRIRPTEGDWGFRLKVDALQGATPDAVGLVPVEVLRFIKPVVVEKLVERRRRKAA